jgi:hypothetical protein
VVNRERKRAKAVVTDLQYGAALSSVVQAVAKIAFLELGQMGAPMTMGQRWHGNWSPL